MNLTESMKLSDGYKFVWEFTPSQGNGTIAAVGLTSKHGGANAYGSEVAVDTTLLQIKKVSLDDEDGFINDLFRCVTVDFTNAKLYSLSYESNTVTIKEYVFAWGGAYLNQYRYTWILTPYLATISNLSQAVVKNADKTMKITYTLTEQTVT